MVTHDPGFSRHAERQIHLFDGRVVEHPRPPEQVSTLYES